MHKGFVAGDSMMYFMNWKVSEGVETYGEHNGGYDWRNGEGPDMQDPVGHAYELF